MSLIQHHNEDNISYDDFKKEAIKSQLIVTELPLNSFELGRNQTIKIEGEIMPTSDSAYTYFLKNVLQINPAMIQRFKKATDEKTELQMLELMRAGLASKKRDTVKVVANPNKKVIESFLGPRTKMVSNEAMLNIFETIMDRFPELSLKDAYLDKSTGAFTLNARKNEQVDIGIGENFHGGITISNNLTNGSIIGTNILRLICANGMVGTDTLKMDFKNTNEGLKNLISEIEDLKKHNFISANFIAQREIKEKFKASLYELNFVRDVILNFSNLSKEQVDLIIPYEQVKHHFKVKGLDIDNLTIEQSKNLPIPFLTGWDLVNFLTDFGSHNYGYDSDFQEIQRKANALFLRKPTTANLPPIF